MSEDAMPKEDRYGWVMVAIAAICNGTAIGMLSTVAIFAPTLETTFNWGRGDIMAAYTIGAASIGIGGIIMGHLSDKYSTRPVVLFGIVMFAIALFLLSTVSTTGELYLYYAMLGGLGGAAIFAPMVANVGFWFHANRGLALGLATAGQAFGQAMVPFTSSFIIAAVGWSNAYLALGTASLVVLLILAMFIRVPKGHEEATRRARAVAQQPQSDDAPLNVWTIVAVLSIATVFCCITMATPLLHVASLARDKGFSHDQAATVFALIGITAMFGRVAYGKLADSIGGLNAYLTGSIIQTCMVFWFTQIDSINGLYAMSVAFGLGYSGVMTSIAVSLRELTPVHRRGVSWGIVALFGWFGMGSGAYFGGILHDQTQSYIVPFGAAVGAGVINVTIVLGLIFTLKTRGNRPKLAPA